MAEKSGRIQIVIKGGQPWGFRLQGDPENRFAVIIDQIEPGGKAQLQGGLKKGDHVIKINDVQCLSLADALQLIDSAFRTLTVLVWRPPHRSTQKSSYENFPLDQVSFIKNTNNSLHNESELMLTSSVFHEFKEYKQDIPTHSFYRKVSFNASSSNYENVSSVSGNYHSENKSFKQPLNPYNEKRLSTDNFRSDDNSLKYYRNKNLSHSDLQQSNLQSIPHTLPDHNLNVQSVCKQYPMSHSLWKNKQDLKWKSLTSHSKEAHISPQYVQENSYGIIRNSSANLISNSSRKAVASDKVSEYALCMYPKCYSRYINCKIHSPPERDDASNYKTLKSNICNISNVYDSSSSSELINDYNSSLCNIECLGDDKLLETLYNHPPSPETKISEFNSQEAISAAPLSCNSSIEIKHMPSKNVTCLQGNNRSLYNSEASNLHVKQYSSNCFLHCSEEKKKSISASYVNNIPLRNNSENSLSDIAVKQAYRCDNIKNQILSPEIRSFHKEATLSVFNQKSTLNTTKLKNISMKPSLDDEENNMIFSSTNNTCLKISENTTIMKLFTPDAVKQDVDEDEELCLIEENVRSSLRSSCASTSPLLPLPSPPDNSDLEIKPTNDPLPSPPSLSPVQEIEVGKPEEAIYANLEMLKIKCSVVNSATQTNVTSSQQYSLQTHAEKKVESSVDTKCKNLAFLPSFASCVFSNLISPEFEKTLNNSAMKTLLRPTFHDQNSSLEDNVFNPEEKIVIERHSMSLPLTSAYFTTSESKAKLLTRYISSFHHSDMPVGGELNHKKEELMISITKKLSILRLEQVALQEEVKQNNELGKNIADKVMEFAKPNEAEKFRLHVEELEKITNLMLSLSGRLARAENALLILPSNASIEEKKVLESKYSKLNQQYEEAKHLKSNIDKRNNHVALILRNYLNDDEFADYDHFIKMKAKLLVDCRELDEKIKLGEEQLSALQASVNVH